MNFLKNMTVAAKLRLVSGIVLVLMMALGAASLLEMSAMNQQTDQILKYRVAGVRDAGHMQYAAARMRTRQYRIAVTKPEQMESALASYQKAVGEFEQASASYEKFIFDDQERKLFNSTMATWKEYLEKSDGYMKAAKAGDRELSISLVTNHAKDFDKVVAAIDDLIKYNDEGANHDAKDVVNSYQTAKYVVIGGVAISALLAFGLTLLIARAISVPLDKAVSLAEKVAKGDLTSVVDYDGRDEVGKLLQSLKRMNDSLVTIVSQVRNGSDSIATGSSEIATGNVDLSQRTEQQAASLQQTAASMEEMNATAKANADSARHAVSIAREASQTASLGGQVVSSVVDTMTEINDSSKKISSIIGVIDEIAFQTNILALNAAVEAARAAEHGRGFAVVASEVRSLAGRSATAAKEIKTLITQSVEKVETGTKQVDQAKQTMDHIVSQVNEVTSLLDGIGSASIEQTEGIGQVNQAVSQLDQVTQQNAALVEESAAAAESLRVQAVQLAETVSIFKLQ